MGSAFFAGTVIFIGDTFGRRKLLTGFSLLMGIAGMGFALTEQYLVLAMVSFPGREPGHIRKRPQGAGPAPGDRHPAGHDFF